MPYIELDVLNNAPDPVLGIDLGTTNSLCAVFRDGRPTVLRTEEHSGVVPSAIQFDAHGEPVVGQAARKAALVHPEQVVFSFKRLMGRRLAEATEDLRNVPFPAEETENGVIRLLLPGDRTATPEQLSALVLERVHQIACQVSGGETPRQCVVTVPAYFDDSQRQATRDAARLAGLEVLRIVNEPTAACLAYGLDTRKEGTVVVYDLGGGTFDVSILSIEEGVFRVLATAGNTHLGGDDVDRSLLAIAEEALEGQVSPEKWNDAAFRQGLRLAAERCKIELSHKPIGDFHVVDADTGLDWRRGVTREEFDALVAPLIDRTLDLCRRVLADAGVEAGELDEVVLVGGSTRIPAVRAAVEAFFGRAPHTELNPDEVVALGAAVQGHILAGGTRDVLLMDVTPLSLGLETLGGAVSKIIHRNSPIPCADKEGFTTHADDQTGIDFNVVQGERELAKDCRSLGRFKLTGIPPMPAGMARVGVRFALDANGMLTVTAMEESTRVSARIEVQPANNLTDEQVEAMLKESYDLAQEDFDARRVADLKVELATMVAASERNLPSVRDRLDPESVQDIEEALGAASAARDADADTLAVDSIQEVRDRLEQATLPLAALLMDDVAKKALGGKSLEEV